MAEFEFEGGEINNSDEMGLGDDEAADVNTESLADTLKNKEAAYDRAAARYTDSKNTELESLRDQLKVDSNNLAGDQLSDMSPDGTKNETKKAFDAITDSVDGIDEEEGKTGDELDKQIAANDKIIIDNLTTKMKEGKLSVKSLSKVTGDIQSKVSKSVKDMCSEKTSKLYDTKVGEIKSLFDDKVKKKGSAELNETDIKELNKKADEVVDQLKTDKTLDDNIEEKGGETEEHKKTFKEKFIKGVQYALGLGCIGGLIWAFLKYSTSSPICYQVKGGPPSKDIVGVNSSACNCDLPDGVADTDLTKTGNQSLINNDCTTSNIGCCAKGVMTKHAICTTGVACSPIGADGGCTYTYTPKSLGGFIGSIVNDAIVKPASGIFHGLGSLFGSVFGFLKKPLEIIVIILLTLLFLYLVFKGWQWMRNRKVSQPPTRPPTRPPQYLQPQYPQPQYPQPQYPQPQYPQPQYPQPQYPQPQYPQPQYPQPQYPQPQYPQPAVPIPRPTRLTYPRDPPELSQKSDIPVKAIPAVPRPTIKSNLPFRNKITNN
jgi:hypothetical protein